MKFEVTATGFNEFDVKLKRRMKTRTKRILTYTSLLAASYFAGRTYVMWTEKSTPDDE
jgi:hypothetical protein